VAPDSCFFDEIPCNLKFSCNLPIRSRVAFCSEALVNPHIHPEQPGWSSDSAKGDEGINHLRRLKGEMAKSAAVEVSPGDRAPATVTALELKERRRSPRLRCSGGVEFQVVGSEVRMWGTLTDISLHGCYVEMNNTFPVGTKVNLVLKSCGIRILSLGIVRTSYPALGMGLCFSEIEPVEQFQLQQLVAMLAGQSGASNRVPAGEKTMKTNSDSGDAISVLNEIREFFRINQLLSRDEFYQITERARRS
jgi:PilZ domain-containing protein